MNEQLILKRISAANHPAHVVVGDLDTSHMDAAGHGTVIFSLAAKRKSCFQQVYINPILAKALVSGRPNKNLDRLLRL